MMKLIMIRAYAVITNNIYRELAIRQEPRANG